MADLLYTPPTYDELMENRVYRAWARKRPKLPANVSAGLPWLVIARRTPEAAGSTWALKKEALYADAYQRAFRTIQKPDFHDVAVVSRRMLFRPPRGFIWDTGAFNWCGRCRRPSVFFEQLRHPALNGALMLSWDDLNRCYYCGARESFAGRMMPRKVLP